MSEDRFASYDAGYVLGALSAHDRQEYEQHLRTCAECARSVREIAGLPGLLAKVPEEHLSPGGAPAEPPPTLLPSLLTRVRRQRVRTRVTAIGAAGLALAACLALVVAVAMRPVTGEQPISIPTVTMSPLASAPVWATVGLEDVAWGTRIDMHCMYEKGGPGGKVYSLVVVNKDGDIEQVGSWTVLPGKDAKLQGGTSWPVRDIEAVEIRTSTGKSLLRMTP
ncbi:MAG: anti-sigma factor [Streptosporangiales bacterium]|nr:anti-sigma factor [Streptosporangiales bacterium]